MASVTFEIPDAKFAEFKEAFLLGLPVPIRPPDILNLKPEPVPEMTDNEWIKEAGRRFYIKAYRKGRAILRDQAHPAVVDDGILE